MKTKLPEEVEQVLLGSLFGDAFLRKNKSKSKGIVKNLKKIGVSFKETHCIKQKDYLLWKKEILLKSFIFGKDYNRDDKKGHYGYTISSLTSPLLDEYYPYFYPTGKGRKVFTLEMLNKLKPFGLAVWYMDDGTFDKDVYRASIAFPKKYREMIKTWLEKTYSLFSTIHINNTGSVSLRFNKKNTKKFFRIIHSYIHPSMKYKVKRTREEYLILKQNKKRYNKKYREENKQYLKQYERKREKLRKSYRKEYYKKNSHKIKAKYKEYRQRPEVKKRARERMREYRKKNTKKLKEYYKKYNKEYQEKNKAKLRLQKRIYYKKNLNKIRKYKKDYNQRPEVKKRIREYIRKKHNIPPEKWRKE